MQNVVFTGRLAADPQVSEDFGRAVFRLLENRGPDRVVGVNCVSWRRGLNEKVILPGLAVGCEVLVVGAFVDRLYAGSDGVTRAAKDLAVQSLTVLDWAPGAAAALASAA